MENIYTGARETIPDVAFLAYATPRAPTLELERGLFAAGIQVLAYIVVLSGLAGLGYALAPRKAPQRTS